MKRALNFSEPILLNERERVSERERERGGEGRRENYTNKSDRLSCEFHILSCMKERKRERERSGR
jgi:hypothetical protein